MARYSRNPISFSITTTAPNQSVEVEVSLETVAHTGSYTVLGTFAFTSDGSAELTDRVDSIIHSALMREASASLPGADLDAVLVPELSRLYRIRHRHYNAGVWTSWTTISGTLLVVLGGEPMEEYADDFATASGTQPIFLHVPGSLLVPRQATGFVYAMLQTTGTVNWIFRHFDLFGRPSGTVSGSFTSARAGDVWAIPMSVPSEELSPNFTLELTCNSVTRLVSLVSDGSVRANTYDFAYLSSRGGWAFLPCTGSMARTLEVSQSVAESDLGPAFQNTTLEQYQPWRIEGRKKHKAYTGFLPRTLLETVMQDFMLSPRKFLWSPDLQRWVPIILESKSVEYRNDFDGDLPSYGFDFRLAFDNNQASSI
jgi:hypothetical protein